MKKCTITTITIIFVLAVLASACGSSTSTPVVVVYSPQSVVATVTLIPNLEIPLQTETFVESPTPQIIYESTPTTQPAPTYPTYDGWFVALYGSVQSTINTYVDDQTEIHNLVAALDESYENGESQFGGEFSGKTEGLQIPANCVIWGILKENISGIDGVDFAPLVTDADGVGVYISVSEVKIIINDDWRRIRWICMK